MIRITIRNNDDNMTVYMNGRLDTAATEQAEKDMEPLYHCDDKDIIFDFTELSYICSAGLRQMLEILKHSRKHGHHVYIKGLCDNIREAFVLTGFYEIFEYI